MKAAEVPVIPTLKFKDDLINIHIESTHLQFNKMKLKFISDGLPFKGIKASFINLIKSSYSNSLEINESFLEFSGFDSNTKN